MPSIVLASRSSTHSLILKALEESLSYQKENISIAIITTASAELKERNKHAVEAYTYFEEDGFRRIQFVDIEKESPNILEAFDVIYLSGGDPYYLLHQLRKSGADNVLSTLHAAGRVLIGISAGGMVLGPSIEIADIAGPPSPYSFYPERDGLKLFNFHILYHANRFENQIDGIRKRAKSGLVELTDDQVLFLKNGQRRLLQK